LSHRERLFWLCVGVALIVLFISIIPSHYEICEVTEKTKEEHCTTYQVVPFVGIKVAQILDKAGGIITALATIAIAIFTLTLKRATDKLWDAGERQLKLLSETSAAQSRDMKASIATAERSAEIAREAMIAGERAFVFATGVLAFWEIDQTTGHYMWRFRPNWENSGDTPTKNMTMCSECLLVPSPIPPGFSFDYSATEIGTALIPPKNKGGGGLAPRFPAPAITAQDIIDVQESRKFLYFMGWARYFDVFPDTPQHITRFCWQILVLGDPLRYDPSSNLQNLSFSNIHHFEGNCADDECK